MIDISKCSTCNLSAREVLPVILMVHAQTIGKRKIVWVTCSECEKKEMRNQ